MAGGLQKPERDPGVTERMVEKSRQIHQGEIFRRKMGLVIVLILIVAAVCAAYYFCGGGTVAVE